MTIGRWLTVLVMLSVIAEVAQGKELELRGKVGEYSVAVRLARNPPIVGDNGITVQITDTRGQGREDATVAINYYMLPMPRMAPMHYNADARLSGGLYRSNMHLIMSGPWVIAVRITLSGRTVATKFNIDVP